MSVKLFNLVKNYFAWMHDGKRDQIIQQWDYYLVIVSTPAFAAADGTTYPEPDLA